MVSPKLAPNTNAIAERLKAFILAIERTQSASDFEFRSLERDLTALMNADAVSAYLMRAELAQTVGDEEGAKGFFANARKLGAGSRADLGEAVSSANRGYFSVAAELLERVPEDDLVGDESLLRTCVTTGAFERHLIGISALERAKLENKLGDRTVIARRAQKVLKELKVSKGHVQAVLDVAGEIMRERDLWWLGIQPEITVINEDDHKSVFYQFAVATSPSLAAAMTLDFVDLLLGRGVDPEPVSVCFVGAATNERHPS